MPKSFENKIEKNVCGQERSKRNRISKFRFFLVYARNHGQGLVISRDIRNRNSGFLTGTGSSDKAWSKITFFYPIFDHAEQVDVCADVCYARVMSWSQGYKTGYDAAMSKIRAIEALDHHITNNMSTEQRHLLFNPCITQNGSPSKLCIAEPCCGGVDAHRGSCKCR